MSEKSLTPKQRIREFEDIERSIRYTAKEMLETPFAFRDGVHMEDKNYNFKLSLYVDQKGVYGSVTNSKGKVIGVTLEKAIEIAQKFYLLHYNGYENLIEAVISTGREYRAVIGKNTLIITPNSANKTAKIVYEAFNG